jgi:hypothetical protein
MEIPKVMMGIRRSVFRPRVETTVASVVLPWADDIVRFGDSDDSVEIKARGHSKEEARRNLSANLLILASQLEVLAEQARETAEAITAEAIAAETISAEQEQREEPS